VRKPDGMLFDERCTMTSPKLSVVMSVYNAEAYLAEAIQSILDQTYRDFELIIVSEHGSSKGSLDIIGSFQDPRIIHIHNDERLGLIRSLNKALSQVRGEYIARMDGDDVCIKDRFELQIEYLERNPEVAAVGSAIAYIDDMGIQFSAHRYPDLPTVVRWNMFFNSSLANSSVMLRSQILSKVGLYDESTPVGEDYGLWLRILKVSEISNMRKTLLKYRFHGGNISLSHKEEGRIIGNRLACDAVSDFLGRECPIDTVACLRDRSQIRTKEQAHQASELLTVLHRMFVGRVRPSLSEKVQIQATTTRLQMAISLKRLKVDPLDSCKLLAVSFFEMPGLVILGLVPGLGQLFTYSIEMRRLNRRSQRPVHDSTIEQAK
jgi:hypothetical protein